MKLIITNNDGSRGQQENISGSGDSQGPRNSLLLPKAKPRVIVNCFQAQLNPESQMDFSTMAQVWICNKYKHWHLGTVEKGHINIHEGYAQVVRSVAGALISGMEQRSSA